MNDSNCPKCGGKDTMATDEIVRIDEEGTEDYFLVYLCEQCGYISPDAPGDDEEEAE